MPAGPREAPPESGNAPLSPELPTVHLASALLRRYGIAVARILLPAFFIWLAWHELSSIDVQAVRRQVAMVPAWELFAALLAALSAIVIAGLYDVLAFPDLERLSWRRRWAMGSVLNAWTNFFAVGPFGGPALRLFIYRRAGLDSAEIAARLAILYTGMISGFIAWCVVAWIPLGSGVAAITWRAGLAVALAPVNAVAIATLSRRVGFLRALHEDAPVRRIGVVGAVDWGLALVTFVLVARAVGITLPVDELARTVFAGHAVGLASMVPGGLGSADAVWLALLVDRGVAAGVAAADVLLFRCVLYVIPWLLSLLVLYLMFSGAAAWSRAWQRRVIAAAVAANAMFLLASTATPVAPSWLRYLGSILPLGLLEASHLVSVSAAAVMVFLLRGILRGYRSALLMVATALFASALAHILRGAAWAQSATCFGLLLMLIGARDAFRKQGRIPIRGELVLATALSMTTFFVLVGVVGRSDVSYDHALWTLVTPTADASRFLRGIVWLGFLGLAFFIRQAVAPGGRAVFATSEEIDDAVRFIQTNGKRGATLGVACGDKAVWRLDDRGLVVYQRRGDKMIVFGEPVAAPGHEAAVLGSLHRHAEEADLELVFYQVGVDWMRYLHDYGFELFKLGEEGIVDLQAFNMEGGKRKHLRRTVRKVEEAGICFRVLEPPVADDWIEQAGRVSDAWLAEKGIHEMQFSLGYFSPGYVRRFRLGAAVDAAGNLVAFVNFLDARPGTEITLDFVRYEDGVVEGLMDYVLINSFLWAREQGFATFNLGMAPLYDVGDHAGAAVPERLARLAFLHGESFYNYRGLQAYKDKFDPQWQPRYLAYENPWDWAGATLAAFSLVQARGRADRRRIAAARRGDA